MSTESLNRTSNIEIPEKGQFFRTFENSFEKKIFLVEVL